MPKNPNRKRGFIMRRNWPKARRLAAERLMLHLRGFDYEQIAYERVKEHIPEAWETLEEDVDVEEKKIRVTLLLDESVAKFYRAMGRGYQARMNRVLATFAQMRIAQVTLHEFERAALEDKWEAEQEAMGRRSED